MTKRITENPEVPTLNYRYLEHKSSLHLLLVENNLKPKTFQTGQLYYGRNDPNFVSKVGSSALEF